MRIGDTEVEPHRFADGSEEARPRHFMALCHDPECDLCPEFWRHRNRAEQEDRDAA